MTSANAGVEEAAARKSTNGSEGGDGIDSATATTANNTNNISFTLPKMPPPTAKATRQRSTSTTTSTKSAQTYTSAENYAVQHGIAVGKDGSRINNNNLEVWQSIQGKLFEREQHQQLLQEAYRRRMMIVGDDDETIVTNQSFEREIVVITGPSGTGKSVLALSLHENATEDGVYMLYGKCDQIKKSEPLAPFIYAFSEFVNQVLERSTSFQEEDDNNNQHILDKVKEAIERATVDSDVEFLTDMIPSFAKLLPPNLAQSTNNKKNNNTVETTTTTTTTMSNKRSTITRPNTELPGIAIICKLLKELCTKEGFRIILFIDDLQWLDYNSLQMLRNIALTPNLSRFMLLGTCRGNEVSIQAELSVVFRKLEKEGVIISEIQVENLHENAMTQMLLQLLQSDDEEEVRPLVSLAQSLTNGNPFFFVELMRSFFDERLLFLNEDGKWTWNESEILRRNAALENTEISDAIVQGVIRSESDPIKETLEIASCLGAEFYVQHIQVAASTQPHIVNRAIEVLLYRRVIVKTNEVGVYRWAHDRFQQSAYRLIPEQDCTAFRYRVGKKLLDSFSHEEIIEHSFLVSGLIYGGELFLETESEREKIAELYSIAGGKAAHSSAFEDAAAYFRKGIELLPPDHWERESLYPLCHQLYNCLAEMECCLGNTTRVDELCSTILAYSRTLEDQMRAYDTRIYSLSYRNEMNDSIRVGLDVLRKLGIPVPRRVGIFLNIKELVTTRSMLKRFTTEQILNQRPLRKWKKAAALQIINLVFPAVLRSQPEYALFLTAKAIKITLRDGLSPLSAVLFSMFSMILCNPVGAVQEGIRCEEIGHRIFEKFQANDLRSRMFCIRFAYTKPYTDPMSKCIPGLVAGRNAGMSTGDIELSFINSFVYSIDGILSGLPLRAHHEKMIQFKEQYGRLGQETVMFYMNIAIQLVQNLMGMVENVHVLSGQVLDANESLKTFIATNNASGKCFLMLAQLFLALFIGDDQEAVAVARRLQRINMDNFTAFDVQYIPFLVGMSEMIAARTTKNNKVHVRAGTKALKQLEKVTRFHTTDCWLSRVSLIRAERDALQGLNEEATRKYFLAAEKAAEHGYIHEEALALERVGLLLLESDEVGRGLECLHKAQGLYEQWGCVVKSSMISEFISARGEQSR